MKKIITLISLFVFGFSNQAQTSFWQKTSIERLTNLEKMERSSLPKTYHLYHLDFNALKQALQNAPLDKSNTISNLVIAFPNANGELKNFRIYEAPIMEAGLAAKFPDIKTYRGLGIDNPNEVIRFSVTLFGLHTMTLNSDLGTQFIDTFTKDLSNYIVYKKSDLTESRNFSCGVKEKNTKPKTNVKHRTLISDGKFREFRLAMACTIEYAAFHISAAGQNSGTVAQKKAAVQAAMVVTMTRVNGIFENDLAIRMNFVNNNDQVIFVVSDNFTNNDGDFLINQSQTQITNIIGSANFDIGHTVSTGGGGLASTPSVCEDDFKASAITGNPSPVGDTFNVDYVAHEMGHQFGAFHTFNSSVGSCGGGNRDPETAVEVGSGTTIMGYAGICDSDNVQANSDAYFHETSIQQINETLDTSANCGVITINNNAAPVVNAGLDYTIPKSTAFVLRGNATDANATANLTYCWEQFDLGTGTSPPSQTQTTGPLYRSLKPSTSPNRYFPELASVVLGNLYPTWEKTPSVARNLNFALTVRDNQSPLGGQTNKDNVLITVNGTAGPFTVTSQASAGINYTGNSSQTITWNVAGTTGNGVNTANVKISLSTDGGVTFDTVLLASTANDGTENVTIPNIDASNCRIMVEGVGNVFYAVNSGNFSITKSLSNNVYGLNNFELFPNPNKGDFTIKFNSNSSANVNINISDMNGRLVYINNFENKNIFSENIKLNNLQQGIYLVNVQVGESKEVRKLIINN